MEHEDGMVTGMNGSYSIDDRQIIRSSGDSSMKQLSRNENHRSYKCQRWNLLLVFVSIQCLLLSGFATGQASAAGGDLARPAASDSPQPGKQEAIASVVDSAGNLIVTGYQNLAGLGDDDYLTVKFNANGTVAWRKSYNRSGGSDQATAIVLDSNNNVIVTGFAWNGNNYDIYTIKYSGVDGAKLWDHTYNAPALGNDIATSIAIDNLDNVYVGGYVQTTSANEDYVILKYSVNGPNPDGTPVWVATWNGAANGTDKLTAIAAGVGGVAVTGQSWGGTTNFDIITVKYDYNGTKLWEKRYTSSGGYPDGGRKVALDAAGNVIITAAVTNSGNLDIYTAKYPAAGGDPLWEKTYNNPINNDEPAGLLLDSSGNVYVTGYTFTLSGNEDLLVVRYKGTDGTKEWEKVYDSGLSNSDFGTDLLLDRAGNLLVTGNAVTTDGNHNIITLKIKNDSSNPALYWAATYDGPAGKNEETLGIGIGLGTDGEIVVGGWTDVWTADASDEDYLMLVYDSGLINPPSLLTATVLTDTDVKIDWADNSGNEDGFRIERKLTELGAWSEVGTVGANITTFTDTYANGLRARNTYYYRLRSYNAANGSSNSSEEIRVLTLYVNYQVPNWSYLYNNTDGQDDYPAGIAVGPDKNPVVTGYSLLSTSGFDYFTLKLNNDDGALLWSDRYNDADDQLDRATSVVVDSTNAAVVTGYSSLYYPPAGDNINSIYTLKYPASCSPPTPCTPASVWHGQYNGPGAIDDRAVAVATTVDAVNSVIVTGYGKNAAENEDIYLLKYSAVPALDGFGKAIPDWTAIPYDSAFHGDDFPVGVVTDKDGNVFIAGHVQSSSSPVRYKGFVAKYCGKAGAPCNGKLPGEIIWEDSFAGAGDNRTRSLVLDSAGNLYVAGYDTGANGRDILLIKYDGKAVPTGSRVLWSRTADGAAHGDDAAASVKYDLIDDTVVVGGTVLTASGDHDLIVIRFDSSGNQLVQRSKVFLRPGSDEEAFDMAMDLSGNVSIAGYTSNGITADAISVEYDYAGTLLAATIYNGTANSYDEATAVTFNSLGDTLVAGYSTNAAGNADYLVYKRNGLALQASAPFTVSQYYTKVDLAWSDTSTGETGFYVERKTGACNSDNPWALIFTAPANTTTYSNTGLNAGQEYCYRVRSFKNGEIDPRWIERYTLLDNPLPPGNVIPSATNTTRVDLTWQDNTSGETGFRIFRCAGASCTDFFELNSVGSNVVTYSDTTVAAGTSYSYKIIAYKTADWESGYSATAAVTTSSPATPTALTAARVSEGQINLSWSDTNSDETGYKIERCEAAACSYSQLATVAANITTYTDTALLKIDTVYRYRVQAYKTAISSWDGPYSATAEATTTLATTSALAANPANTTAINLSWTDNTGTETGFKIERCLGSSCSDFVEVGQTVSSATTWGDTGVCSGSTYTYRVSAINTGLAMSGGGVWTRRKPLTISNFQPGLQTKLTIAYDSDMKANFDDIRFYDEINKQEIPYYLESKTDSSTATVWIKTGANNVIYLYYGNNSALSASNGAAAFELFDDFDSLASWTVTGSSVAASGGIVTVDSGGAAALYRNFNIAYPYIAESRYLYPTANANRNRLAITTSAGAGPPTGFDYGLFNSGSPQVYWNGWTGVGLTINTWYLLQWEVKDSDYSFRVFNTSGTQLLTRSTGAAIADLKRAYFSGTESATSDFNLDWFRIRKYAATVPTVSFGAEGTSAGYTFTNTWTGSPSATASATTATPAAPGSPSATRVSEARLDLAWTDTTADETGFRIERCKGAACTDFTEIGTVGAGVTTYSDTSPMDVDSSYRYQIRANKTATCNGGWNGPYSAITAATTTLVAPSGLSATASVSTACDDLRFTASDGATLLNYWVESGCGTAATKVWLKAPALPVGARQFYLYWANPLASAFSSGAATFDFYDDFSGTTIDTGKWVKGDAGVMLSQNEELIAAGGTGSWGGTFLYSAANFTRPFILELKHKHTGGSSSMFGVKDTTTGTTYSSYPYASYRPDATQLYVYESGSSRGSLGTLAANIWEYFKYEVLGTGAKYYVGTSPAAYSLYYDSSYSAASPLKIGFDNANQAFRLDDVRVRKYASPVPTFTLGAIEGGSFSLTGGTWNARRPLTVTNGGAALTDYQQELTINTSGTASDRISMTWTDNSASETGFIVERCSGAACDFSAVDTYSVPANVTAFVDKSVALATTYCYRVKAEKSAVWVSAPTNSACATTTTITAPSLSVTTTTANALSWTDTTTGEDGFSVERCVGAACDFSTVDSGFPLVFAPGVITYTDASVCAPAYRYRVRNFKYGPSGWSKESNIVDANTIPPTPPGGFSAARISEVQINLAWTDNTTDETGFKLERCTGVGCDFTVLDGGFPKTVPANVTSYQDTGLAPDTTYRYRVSAYKSGGCGWDSAYSAESGVATAVAAPLSLTAAAPISTQVNLAWTAADTASETGFSVLRCSGVGCTPSTAVETVAPNAVAWSDTRVCSNTDYVYGVSAVNNAGFTYGGGGDWFKRRPLIITNFQANTETVFTLAYIVGMKSDFSDIRFYDETVKAVIPYWLESKTDGVTAKVWIKTGSNNAITLYYGNASASSAGNGSNVFQFFDDFSYASLADSNFTAKWTVDNSGGFSMTGSALRGTNTVGRLTSKATFSPGAAGIVQEIKATSSSRSQDGAMMGGFFSNWASSFGWLNHSSAGIYCNNGVWTNMVGLLPVNSALLYSISVLNGTTINPKVTNYDTGTVFQDLGSLANSVDNAPIAIGLRYDGYAPNQAYSNDWDWVRVRTYSATAPVVTLGSEETNGSGYNQSFAVVYTGPASTVSIKTPILAAPTSLTVTRNSESQLTVSWPNVTGESVFELDRCVGNLCDFSSKTTVEVPADTLSYIDKGLLPGTYYRYRVRSRADAFCQAYSSYNTTPAQAQTTVTAPGSLTATALNTTQVNLAWVDNTASDTGFKIERCLGAGCSSYSQIAVTGASATSYEDTAVCPGSVYGYRIAALNSGLSNDGSGCWTRRKPVTISSFVADFQTRVVVAYDSDMKSDFSDIRFYDPATYQELPYWIESKTDSTTASVWVKTRTSSTIYLYYGNAAAASSANGAATFQFFDDFKGTTINTNKWTTVGSYYSQNDELISTGGSGAWDSGMYSVTNFSTPFVFEIDQYRTAGGNMMIGAKNTGTGVNYTDFTHAAYPVYDGNGNRLLVYEDGNWRGDNLKAVSSDVWQYYKFDILYPGANFYHGSSPATYSSYYSGTYSYATPLKAGFTNANMAFRLDNARVRKYANPEPAAVVGTEEQSVCYTFTGAYTSGYSNAVAATTPAPAAPTTLTATATNDTNINLTWSDLSNDEMTFRVERCSGNSCSSFAEIATVGANVKTYSSSVLPSTDYCYRVRADKSAACSTGWPTNYSNTACDKSFSPRTDSLVATATGPFAVRLDWHDLATDEDGYIVQVMAWNGKWVNIATTLPDVTSYLDLIGLEPLKTYTYRVRPYRGSDYSPFVWSNPVTTPPFTQGAGTCP